MRPVVALEPIDPARRRLLLAAMAGVAPIAPDKLRIVVSNVTPVTSFGAKGDGVTDDTAALLSALATNKGNIRIPRGNYLFSRPIPIAGGNRQIVFDEGAVLRGRDPLQYGILVSDTADLLIAGATLEWTTTPAHRTVNAAIHVFRSKNVKLQDITVTGGGGAGILFEGCDQPVVINAHVQGTLADGVHFANCSQSQARTITTSKTGDDGLAFLNYQRLPDKQGGYATDIKISDSMARGISVDGQSGVTVENFSVERTRASGLYVAQDVFYATRFPARVILRKGTVQSPGTLPGPKANRFGIEIRNGRDVTLEDVKVIDAKSRLLDVYQSYGTITARRLVLSGNEDAEGIHLQQSEAVVIEQTAVQGAKTMGLYARQINQLTWNGLTIQNSGNDQSNSFAGFVSDIGTLQADNMKVVCDTAQCSHRFAVADVKLGRLSTPMLAASGNDTAALPMPITVERSPNLAVPK